MNAYSPMSAALVKGLTAWEGQIVGGNCYEAPSRPPGVSRNALEHAELCPRGSCAVSPLKELVSCILMNLGYWQISSGQDDTNPLLCTRDRCYIG